MALTMLPKITAEVNFVMQIKHNLLICRLSYDLSTSLYTPLPASFTTASDNEMADENYNFVRLMREGEAMEQQPLMILIDPSWMLTTFLKIT